MDPLLEPIEGADRREVGGVVVEIVRVGNGRVKRAIYPPGFRWSTHMRPTVRSEQCQHAHVGFLARGHIQGEYGDGCTFEFVAPQVVAIEPGTTPGSSATRRRCSSSSTPRRERRAASGSPPSTATSLPGQCSSR